MSDDRPVWRLDRLDAALALGLGVAVSWLYLRTLAHGLLIDDSGEFQAMTRLLGHTHPTGYEVYTLFARGFTALTRGDFPTRVSAFSAMAGGAMAALVYVTARLLGSGRPISIAPALAVAAAPTIWSQAIIAEVYTPAAVLWLVVLGSVLAWYRTGAPWWLAVAGAAGGLSLGVHFTIGLLLPAVIAFLLVAAGRVVGGTVSTPARRGVWLPAIAGVAVGVALAVGAFAVVDARDPPGQYFDAVVAPSRSAWDLGADQIDGVVERLRFDWTARQFSSQMFTLPGLAGERLATFRSTLTSEIGALLVVAAIAGVGWLAARDWRLALLMTASLAAQLIFAFNYDIGELIYVFYIPAYIVMALLAASGLTAGVRGLEYLRIPPRWGAAGVAAVAVVAAVVPVARGNLPAAVEGRTPEFAFEGYPYEGAATWGLGPVLGATVEALPENAVVFVDWEVLYPLTYVAYVERVRPDLSFHETYAADDQEGVAESLVEYVGDALRDRPVLVSDRIPELEAAGFTFTPSRAGPTVFLSVNAPAS